jgi:hypothetical protein
MMQTREVIYSESCYFPMKKQKFLWHVMPLDFWRLSEAMPFNPTPKLWI